MAGIGDDGAATGDHGSALVAVAPSVAPETDTSGAHGVGMADGGDASHESQLGSAGSAASLGGAGRGSGEGVGGSSGRGGGVGSKKNGVQGGKDSDNDEAATTDAEAESKGTVSEGDLDERVVANSGAAGTSAPAAAAVVRGAHTAVSRSVEATAASPDGGQGLVGAAGRVPQGDGREACKGAGMVPPNSVNLSGGRRDSSGAVVQKSAVGSEPGRDGCVGNAAKDGSGQADIRYGVGVRPGKVEGRDERGGIPQVAAADGACVDGKNGKNGCRGGQRTEGTFSADLSDEETQEEERPPKLPDCKGGSAGRQSETGDACVIVANTRDSANGGGAGGDGSNPGASSGAPGVASDTGDTSRDVFGEENEGGGSWTEDDPEPVDTEVEDNVADNEAKEDDEQGSEEGKSLGQCPWCQKEFPMGDLNAHVNACLDESPESPAKGVSARAEGGAGAASEPLVTSVQGAGSISGGGSTEDGGANGGVLPREEDEGGDNGGVLPRDGEHQENDVERGACPLCLKLFPVLALNLHANTCLEEQARKAEEEEKKASRAQRSARSVPIVKFENGTATVGDGGGGRHHAPPLPSTTRPVRAEGAAGDAASTMGSGSEAKSATGKRKGRGDDSVAVGGGQGTGGGGASYRRDLNGIEKRGEKIKGKFKGKGRLVARGSTGESFQCPQKMKGCKKMAGCGAMNTRYTRRCCRCNIRLWEPLRGGGQLRLGDEVRFLETPFSGQPTEKKLQRGFVNSLDDGGLVSCTYKYFPGYISASIKLEDVTPVPLEQRIVSRGSSTASGLKRSAGSSAPAVKKHKGKSGGASSSLSKQSSGMHRSALAWGRPKCRHVASGQRVNYNGGQCRQCHKTCKRTGRPKEEAPLYDDPVEERKESNRPCNTPGCERRQGKWGVCWTCWDRATTRESSMSALRAVSIAVAMS